MRQQLCWHKLIKPHVCENKLDFIGPRVDQLGSRVELLSAVLTAKPRKPGPVLVSLLALSRLLDFTLSLHTGTPGAEPH